MNTLWTIICMIFCAIMGYAIGLHRGFKCYEHDYDEGYNDALAECEKNYEMTPISTMLDDLYAERKKDKVERLIDELDELFDEDRVIDCGDY